MEPITFQNKQGYQLNLEAFELKYFYGNWIKQANIIIDDDYIFTSMLDNITYPSSWGDVKAYVNKKTLINLKGHINPYIISAWVSSITTNFDGEFIGTHAVFTWMLDSINKPILSIVSEMLSDVDYSLYAQNYAL